MGLSGLEGSVFPDETRLCCSELARFFPMLSGDLIVEVVDVGMPVSVDAIPLWVRIQRAFDMGFHRWFCNCWVTMWVVWLSDEKGKWAGCSIGHYLCWFASQS